MTMLYATTRLLDSVWTLKYEIVDEKIKIHTYDRENTVGYEQENSLPKATLIEDSDRNVLQVELNDEHTDLPVVYEVLNPQFVFSYKE